MKFDTDGYKYRNTRNGVVIGNSTYQLNSLRVKDFYNTLLLRNFSRPHTKHMWQTLTDTKFSKIEWQNIYKRNYETHLKKFAEFKYKIFMNILSCGVKINRWNPNVSK